MPSMMIDIKISIIDICYTNMAPILKTLHDGDSCQPYRYRSFEAPRTYSALDLKASLTDDGL